MAFKKAYSSFVKYIIILYCCQIVLVIVVFVRISLRVRKNGGSLTTTTIAATYEFFNKDKSGAIEQIIEVKAHKKMEEQSTGILYEELKQKDLKK